MKLTKIKKSHSALVPIIKSNDPGFNHEYAQKMANVVMKMDEDEARMFTEFVVREVLETTIEKNQRTLQSHLDHVVKRQTERVKKALAATVAKSKDESVLAYAQALQIIEKAKNQYDLGYEFEESDFRRDPHSGRFQTKIRVNENAKDLDRKQEHGIGIPDPDTKDYKLTGAQRAQYQQEYRQIANFLTTVSQAGTLGDHAVHMQIENKVTGDRHIRELNGAPKAGTDWDPNDERVIGVQARPSNLTLGGAAFGLTNSLGGSMGRETVRGINRGGENFEDFSTAWTKDVDYKSSNARLYNNLAAGSGFLAHIAPNGSHAQIAAKFGEFAGSHGAEAEKIFGPPTRKAAYRFRGTERTPDDELMLQYTSAVRGSRNRGLLRSEVARGGGLALTPEQRGKLRSRVNRAYTREIERKASKINEGRTSKDFVPIEAVSLTQDERRVVQRRESEKFMAEQMPRNGAPTATGLEAGREVVGRYMMQKVEDLDKNLYGLHLDAGNTPPSEGIMIDAKGQIISQVVGYGDDHYLPFNLKNLKGLKGGEYFRTRSVGGPTSEDIYVGLMAGARQITVMSRSGTFTVTFKDDFRGGRRYNDKAQRMVNRYQRILDSVQSEKVDRENVDPRIRAAITDDVRQDMRGGFSGAEIQAEITRRLNDFKQNPILGEQDESAIDNYIDARTRNMPENESRAVAAQLRNQVAADKEYKFRLNGDGYAAALKTLAEQFPYYIEVNPQPRKDPERHEPEKDKGYVEPGRNRPTAANGTYHGTPLHPGGSYTKIQSASDQDFQRDIYGSDKVGVVRAEEERDANGKLVPKGNGKDKEIERKIKNRVAEHSRYEAAVAIQGAIRNAVGEKDREHPQLSIDGREAFKDPKKLQEFDEFFKANKHKFIPLVNTGVIDKKIFTDYEKASGRVNRVGYSNEQAFNPDANVEFTEAPYETGAERRIVVREMEKLDRFIPVTVTGKKMSELTESEYRAEIVKLGEIHAALDDVDVNAIEDPQEKIRAKRALLKSLEIDPSQPGVAALLDSSKDSKLFKQAKATHQARALSKVIGEMPEEEQTVTHKEPESAENEPNIDAKKRLEDAARILTAESQIRLADHPEDEDALEMAAAAVDAKKRLQEHGAQIGQAAWDQWIESNRKPYGQAIHEYNQRVKDK